MYADNVRQLHQSVMVSHCPEQLQHQFEDATLRLNSQSDELLQSCFEEDQLNCDKFGRYIRIVMNTLHDLQVAAVIKLLA